MNSCAWGRKLQAMLDGELDAGEGAEVRAHAERCAACGAELGVYARLYAALDRLREIESPFGLTGRILDRVLPSRIRLRWVRALGWAYGTAAAVVTFAGLTALSNPQARERMGQWLGDLAHGGVRLLLVGLNQMALGAGRLADVFGFLDKSGEKVVPLARALEQAAVVPAVQTCLWGALLASVVLFGWMRTQARGARNGGSHGRLLLA